MSRLTVISIAGVTALLSVLLACGTLALAVRLGMVREQLHWFPPNSRYQVIVRVGSDALPWDRQSNQGTAINLWVHGRGTGWHIVRLLRVPLGQPDDPQRGT
jgi:hypothetical protein